ncbi:PAN domain protein, partial [Ostertagia ostertagi]
CIINFQLDEEADTLHFNHYEVEKVKSVNDCARICFRGRCAAAVYSPRRGECLLGADYKDTCSNADATIRYLKQEDVKIQCFRCSSPRHFEKELAQASAATTEPVEISHQEDRAHISAHEDQTPPPTTTSGTTHQVVETSTTESSAVVGAENGDVTPAARKNCLIKFQASPFSERPPEFNAPFEIEVPVDGCSGAKYDPKAGSCALSYNDKQFCARRDKGIAGTTVSIASEASTPTTQESMIETTTSSGTTDQTSTSIGSEPSSTTTKSQKEEGGAPPKTASPTEFQRGCLIKFQASPFEERPKEFTAPFELELLVDPRLLCATRCVISVIKGVR